MKYLKIFESFNKENIDLSEFSVRYELSYQDMSKLLKLIKNQYGIDFKKYINVIVTLRSEIEYYFSEYIKQPHNFNRKDFYLWIYDENDKWFEELLEDPIFQQEIAIKMGNQLNNIVDYLNDDIKDDYRHLLDIEPEFVEYNEKRVDYDPIYIDIQLEYNDFVTAMKQISHKLSKFDRRQPFYKDNMIDFVKLLNIDEIKKIVFDIIKKHDVFKKCMDRQNSFWWGLEKYISDFFILFEDKQIIKLIADKYPEELLKIEHILTQEIKDEYSYIFNMNDIGLY
jgi:hypothetical protein